MERLTKRIEGLEEASLSCEKCGKAAISECWSQEDCTQTAVDRLSAIEDILGDDYDLDRLRWLIEMDKAGMFIPIPCKVGDTVYVITFACGSRLSGQEIIECLVNTMRVKSDGVTIGYSCRGRYSNGNYYIGNFVFKSIGKTVFLTRKAAEDALNSNK